MGRPTILLRELLRRPSHCKISWWSAYNVLNKNIAKLNWISNSTGSQSSSKYSLEMCVLQKSYFLWEFKLKLCMCAQRGSLGTRTKFQLEIYTINVISGIIYFREFILQILVKQPTGFYNKSKTAIYTRRQTVKDCNHTPNRKYIKRAKIKMRHYHKTQVYVNWHLSSPMYKILRFFREKKNRNTQNVAIGRCYYYSLRISNELRCWFSVAPKGLV